VITFTRLERASFIHSLVYLALLLVAFGLHNPQPATFILGLSHGLLWIGMSLVCLTAARMRIVPLRVAVAVAVLGGIGPFFGSAEFIRESRRRARASVSQAEESAERPR
jgi:type IV secretory pathway VirB6-like protein